MKDSFSINDLALITGLSTRTIRTYIAAGFLSGEKNNGAWVFMPEQVHAFLQNKAVQPAIKAKKNAIVYDFMGTKPYNHDKMCTILDLNDKEALSASVFFCERISKYAPETELHFASDPLGPGVRLILSGSPKDVMSLLNQFYNQ
ncbi:MAG: helix-turn-helix domain-containing protein [Clostridiales bacterium]|nr:helix-turn-helix domain-containing protein [Clostridiales bacterium]